MRRLYQEFGISLVFGNWNWIWASYEIEDEKNEQRFWWIKFWWNKIDEIYFRIWFWKKVFVFSNKGFLIKNKSKIWLKIVFGFWSDF